MIGSVYGADAADQFNKIWSAHNGFFVDYTTGLAGAAQTITVDVPAGSYTIFCSLPGHESLSIKGTLTVSK